MERTLNCLEDSMNEEKNEEVKMRISPGGAA